MAATPTPEESTLSRAQLLGRIIKEVCAKTLLDCFDAAWRTFRTQSKPDYLLADAHELSAEAAAQMLAEIARECGEDVNQITRAWNRYADEACNGGATPYELSAVYVRALYECKTEEEVNRVRGLKA